MNAKPTAARCYVKQSTNLNWFVYSAEGCKTDDIVAGVSRYNHDIDTSQANAEFIADAFTVLHETGLTPRTLADQRAELLAALAEAECALRGAVLEIDRLEDKVIEQQDYIGNERRLSSKTEHYEFKANEARAAIARAEAKP